MNEKYNMTTTYGTPQLSLSDNFIKRLMAYYKSHSNNEILPIWNDILTRFTHLHEAIHSDDIEKVRTFLSTIYLGKTLWGIDWRQDDEINVYEERCKTSFKSLGLESGISYDELTSDVIQQIESKTGISLNCQKYPHRPVFTIDDHSIPCRHVTASHILFKLKQHIKETPRKILEIGSGTGYIALLFRKLYPTTKYYIIDLPIVSVYQACVYANEVGEEHIWFHGETKSDDSLLHILSPDTISDIEDKSIDFCINHNSFPEIPKTVQQSYLNLLRRVLNQNGFLYSINWEPDESTGQYPTANACEDNKFKRTHRSLFTGENLASYYEEIYEP